MQCKGCKKVWDQKEEKAKVGRVERVKYSAYKEKNAIIEGVVERNEKENTLVELDRKLKQSVPRAQKERAGITNS